MLSTKIYFALLGENERKSFRLCINQMYVQMYFIVLLWLTIDCFNVDVKSSHFLVLLLIYVFMLFPQIDNLYTTYCMVKLNYNVKKSLIKNIK